MSRRGAGGKRGPDLSWEDDDTTEAELPSKNRPGPLFPERYIPPPKPPNETEKGEVQSLLRIRERTRASPLFTVLEPSTILDNNGKTNKRAGFDPFTDQDRFSRRFNPKQRTEPSLSHRAGYTLRLFPTELWPVIDPKRKQQEYWQTLSEGVRNRVLGTHETQRKKRKLRYEGNEDTAPQQHNSESDSENEILSPAARRKQRAVKSRRDDPTTGKVREKRGMDAEDDYPEVEQDADEGEGDEEEPVDSEFSENDDEEGDDYNAEQYFSGGENDDVGDEDGDGGGGGEF